MSNETIAPHGGVLINRVVAPAQAAKLTEEAAGLTRISLNERQVSDVEMLAIGAFSPLTGFVTKKDYDGVVNNMRLASGVPWSIPVTLAVGDETAGKVKPGDKVALTDEAGTLLAVMTVEDKYGYDKKHEAEKVYRTTEEAHPGVATVYAQGDTLLGGPIDVVTVPAHDDHLPYRLTPVQTRKYFIDQGWKTVVGFQTRNPVHRAHEYIQKVALEGVDGLLLHPLVGATKSDDIPADVRMKCYQVLLENYYPKDRTLLAVNPAAMRYGGPREAIFHALIRKNYGCTHFIVGRDHAGVGNYYGTFDAQKIFDEFEPSELGITPLKYEHSFYCKACENMASVKTCPHDKESHVILSGTKVREMLRAGEIPPIEFTRPEVAKVLIDSMKE
jgi:sulfate adenylyltransferase